MFKSIINSEPFELSRVTPLVGINESGKTNVLLALEAINPAFQIQYLEHENLPIGHSIEELEDQQYHGRWFVLTKWSFTDDERSELKAICPRIGDDTYLTIARAYGSKASTEVLHGLNSTTEALNLKSSLSRAKRSLSASKSEHAKSMMAAWQAVAEAASADRSDANNWAKTLLACTESFQSAHLERSPTVESALVEIKSVAEHVLKDDETLNAAFKRISQLTPQFLYIADYPDVAGRQNLDNYLKKLSTNELDDADVNFQALMRLAHVTDETLKEMRSYDAGRRNRILNEASIRITTLLRRVWKSRTVSVRLVLTSNELNTLIVDSTTDPDREVNLDDRSKGFQWFFSFCILYASQAEASAATILLLDEPGIHLHPKAQTDLINVLEAQPCQVVYTTHSPFMLSPEDLVPARTVFYNDRLGTVVSDSTSGDDDTQFPLQSFFGYSTTQTLFVGP
jgi:predicted ATP-dependent endonuclease of OLD family